MVLLLLFEAYPESPTISSWNSGAFLARPGPGHPATLPTALPVAVGRGEILYSLGFTERAAAHLDSEFCGKSSPAIGASIEILAKVNPAPANG
jgi:hypothetical protein